MAMVPPALAGQGGGGEVDMKITGQSERGQLGGGQTLSPSSAPYLPAFTKRWASIGVWVAATQPHPQALSHLVLGRGGRPSS